VRIGGVYDLRVSRQDGSAHAQRRATGSCNSDADRYDHLPMAEHVSTDLWSVVAPVLGLDVEVSAGELSAIVVKTAPMLEESVLPSLFTGKGTPVSSDCNVAEVDVKATEDGTKL